MTEEKVITVSGFKTVMEEVNSNIKKVVEVMQFNFKKMDGRFDKVETDLASVKEQIGLLHEGQTEIKGELKQKADGRELSKLEKRVARLEHKVA
ncbi:MAG: hypothetical protein HGA76_01190 [Candidatus Firestonebacteria bacterium]|nr:hypothetical protein [Candidatus Firestonebacteria bacterium]